MEEKIETGYPKSAAVDGVVSGIAQLLCPHKIYLYNQRTSVMGEITGFKLCIIADFADKTMAERDIYLYVDSDIPFDVILYTAAEWERLQGCPDSFANKIYRTGMIVYG